MVGFKKIEVWQKTIRKVKYLEMISSLSFAFKLKKRMIERLPILCPGRVTAYRLTFSYSLKCSVYFILGMYNGKIVLTPALISSWKEVENQFYMQKISKQPGKL